MFSKSQLSLCLEKIEGAAYAVDKDGKITACNDVFLYLTNLKKDEVMGKKISQLDIFSSESMHQNNIMMMNSKAENSSILEFMKNRDDDNSELFQSQKKVLKDDLGKIVGLLNVSKRYSPEQHQDIISSKTKHELRELLNAFFGYSEKISCIPDIYNSKLTVKLKKIVDKLNKIVSGFSVESIENFALQSPQKHWCNVTWISDSIASFVLESEENGLMVERVDSVALSNPKFSDSLLKRQYQIILIDEELLDSLPCDLQEVSESSLIIRVSEGKSNNKNRDVYLPETSYSRLVNEYQTHLPKMWQSYVCRKTIQRVNDNGVLRILSIEDNQDSQNALRQLLELHDFIEMEFCFNAKSAKKMISEYEFDLIVLDLGLPDLSDKSGYDLALWIRCAQKQKGYFLCSIIANTGHEFTPETSELFRLGINEMFRKPNLLRNLDATLMHYVPKSFISEYADC